MTTEVTSLSSYENHTITIPRPDDKSVQLGSSSARRLHWLAAQYEQAQRMEQAARQAYLEAIQAIFEDAGIEWTDNDQYSIDWRTSTISLKPREGV